MAVIIRDLYFSFEKNSKNKPTLNCVNATVTNGSIYALLGPSGCGKTTLLEIIIGLRKPKSGSVLLYGYPAKNAKSGIPGSGVGFMPQDIALQFDLTINEILTYFGTVQIMNAKTIRKESQRLIKSFNLPERDTRIGCLSGGQKRLVSLAVALLHKPRLLILDEPTVGVDPLLRISFWNHLIDLSVNENVTTIITTHYIDEAKRANVVAFMRKGEILSEGNPRQLMDSHHVSTLDDVFLTLCVQQGPRRQSLTVVVADDESNDEYIERIPFKRTKEVKTFEKFSRITSVLIWKHFIEIKRNPAAVVLLFLMTFVSLVAMSIFFGGTPQDLPVAWVVDEIRSHCEWNECIDAIDEQRFDRNSSFVKHSDTVNQTLQSENFEIDSNSPDTKATKTWDPYLPDVLRQSINKDVIQLIEYENIEDAMEALKRRTVYAVIHLKPNFSTNYLDCDAFLGGGYDCQENTTIEHAMINLYPDVSNSIIFNTITTVMDYSIIKFRSQVAKIISIPEEAAKPPFEIGLLFDGTVEESINNLQHFSIAGFLIIFPYVFATLFSILALIANQESDINVRNYASGVKMSQVIIAEIMVRFTLLIVSALLNLFVTLYMFNVPCKGSMLLVICLLATQVLLGITQGIQFASVFNKSMLSFLVCAFLLTKTVVISGTIWSIEAMPVAMQWIFYFLPFSHSVTSMRTLMFKEIATFYPQVAMGFIVSFIWIALNIISAFFTLKLYKK